MNNSNKVSAIRGLVIAAIVAISSILASCQSFPAPSGPRGGQNNPYLVTFSWQNADPCKVDAGSFTFDGETCANNPQTDFCVGRNKWVQWQSTPAKKYDIYLSPFVSSSINAGNNGKAKKRINDKAPWGYYKYTILADNCDADTDAYDPRMRVDH